jgi:hypothetical protein
MSGRRRSPPERARVLEPRTPSRCLPRRRRRRRTSDVGARRSTIAARGCVWPGRPVARTYTGPRWSRQVGESRILGGSDRRRRPLAGAASCYRRAWSSRSGRRGGPSVDAPRVRAYHGGSRDPIPWSPFLRVGARTLRTEQCAKSQCVYPVDREVRFTVPAGSTVVRNCTTGRPIRVCCSVRPTFQQRTRNRPSRPGPTVLYGEFDPGSGRTLAACLTHASRAGTSGGVTLLRGERRTGE